MRKNKKAVMQAQFWKALRRALYEDMKAQAVRGSDHRKGEAA